VVRKYAPRFTGLAKDQCCHQYLQSSGAWIDNFNPTLSFADAKPVRLLRKEWGTQGVERNGKTEEEAGPSAITRPTSMGTVHAKIVKGGPLGLGSRVGILTSLQTRRLLSFDTRAGRDRSNPM
jgi:hypothetical protein